MLVVALGAPRAGWRLEAADSGAQGTAWPGLCPLPGGLGAAQERCVAPGEWEGARLALGAETTLATLHQGEEPGLSGLSCLALCPIPIQPQFPCW